MTEQKDEPKHIIEVEAKEAGVVRIAVTSTSDEKVFKLFQKVRKEISDK